MAHKSGKASYPASKAGKHKMPDGHMMSNSDMKKQMAKPMKKGR